ncbi:anti-phage deoxyguanosine triphosphatase [Legionella genomosp. 1]|uniref:anti-phage deoxyguanosine triphosphatase n=1 Tax=Legionella genomosp. 1 TaxID=1093625 RepID=UPI0010559E24|nr:anti-phage deoxyguanosine triphosphatase [Legionella genomosp. 1]
MEKDDWYIHRLKKREEKENDHRSPFETDRCKVIHSYAFRRLQGKIQVVSGLESDFHRNRLTHSIEVASIAKSIYCNIRERRRNNSNDEPLRLFFEQQDKNDIENLLFTIGLLHDIGHPPLGHGGEYALNYKMHKFGGFEGNAQTLRLITTISPLNLTFRTLLGTLKYPINYAKLIGANAYPIEHDRRMSDSCQISKYLINRNDWAPPKCYYDIDEHIVSEILQFLNTSDKERFQSPLISVNGKHNQSKYKSFDCSIMDIADDISYSIHDLEDAIFFNQVNEEDLEEFFTNQKFISNDDWKKYTKQLLAKDIDQRKKIISKLVHDAIIGTGVFIRTDFREPLLKYYVDFENELLKDFIEQLQKIVRKKLIETQHVKSIIHGGMVVIMQLFDAFLVNSDLLPTIEYEKIKKASSETESRRVISDYISGMTDQYLFKMHQRIFGANNQNTFDII